MTSTVEAMPFVAPKTQGSGVPDTDVVLASKNLHVYLNSLLHDYCEPFLAFMEFRNDSLHSHDINTIYTVC